MAKLKVFESVSLDGYFSDGAGDMSWAHAHDPEWLAFVADNASAEGTLLFGRVTYELMAGFWPTRAAREQSPLLAERMNQRPKLVFSRTLSELTWQNSELAQRNLLEEVASRKAAGAELVVLGSGSIVAQLARADLVDAYQLVVHPVVLGSGRTLFEGVKGRLRLQQTRAFGNGNVVLWYER